MAQTTDYRVPAGYKPTAAVVKANPTVKQFSTGQVIKVPVPSSLAKPIVPTGSFLAGGGTIARTPTGSTNIAGSPPLSLTSSIWIPPSSFSIAPPAYTPNNVQGGRGNIIPTASMYPTYVPPVTTSGGGGGGGGGGGRGGGGGGGNPMTANLPQTPQLGIGNDVYQGMTWRVG